MRSNYITSQVTVKSFVRNDLNGTWGESQIVQGSFPAGGNNYSIRDIEMYVDKLTGFEYVFATVGTQGIYKLYLGMIVNYQTGLL